MITEKFFFSWHFIFHPFKFHNGHIDRKYQSECILASCALQWHSNKTSIYFAWAPSIKWGSKCVNEHLYASHTYLTGKKMPTIKSQTSTNPMILQQTFIKSNNAWQFKAFDKSQNIRSQCSNKCSYIVHKTMHENVGHLSKMGIYACVLP